MEQEAHPNHYALTDSMGRSYIHITKTARWTDAAMALGFFALSMKTPLPISGYTGGRLFIVAFPFGEIIKDSGTFSAKDGTPELTEAIANSADTAIASLSQRVRTSN